MEGQKVGAQEVENDKGKGGSKEITLAGATRYRILPPFSRACSIGLTVGGVICCVVYLFHIGVRYWGGYVVGTAYLHLILALFLPQVFFHFPLSSKSKERLPWYDIIFIFVSFIAPLYFFLNGQAILYEGWETSPPKIAFILGLALWIVVLEAARRAVGWILFFLVFVFSFYPLFAEHAPLFFYGKSYSLTRLVGYNIMGPEGVIGLPTNVFANLLIGFMFFGVVLTFTGAARFFLNFSLSFLGMLRGGTAKVAVMSSSMVGTISGSVITNVITTGSFTIPAMMRSGYPNYYAGAIETCASTGGVLMPPIMGAAAFVMAGLLNIPYGQVALAAAVPSILYYLGLFVQVDGYAAKAGLKGLPKEELPSFWKTIKEGWFYIIAFLVLVYVLFIMRREAQSPFVATIPLLILTMLKKETRLDKRRFLELIERTGRTLGEIAGILSSIGLLIGALMLTGTAQTLSTNLIDLAGGNAYMLVAMGFVASFILGMGLTITACYLLLAVLLAPALVKMGFDPLAVHMFLMYCGMLSFITPPVAIGAYAAAALAGANPMKTGFQAVRLGIVTYFIPIFMVFSPALILHGTFSEVATAIISGFVGVLFLSSGIEGYLLFVGPLGIIGRIISFLGGLFLFKPGFITDIIGLCLISSLFIKRIIFSKSTKERKEETG